MREAFVARILDDVMGAVQAVQAVAPATAGSPSSSTAIAQTTQDRLAALEAFVVRWGPVIERLAPLLEKLEAL